MGRKGFLKEVTLGPGLQDGRDLPKHKRTHRFSRHRIESDNDGENKEVPGSGRTRGEFRWQRRATSSITSFGFQMGKCRAYSPSSWEPPVIVLALKATW